MNQTFNTHMSRPALVIWGARCTIRSFHDRRHLSHIFMHPKHQDIIVISTLLASTFIYRVGLLISKLWRGKWFDGVLRIIRLVIIILTHFEKINRHFETYLFFHVEHCAFHGTTLDNRNILFKCVLMYWKILSWCQTTL